MTKKAVANVVTFTEVSTNKKIKVKLATKAKAAIATEKPKGYKECKRCGHIWKPRTKEPKFCPKCTSTHWDTEKVHLNCALCRHKWIQKGSQKPTHCPKCWCLNWDNAELKELKEITERIEIFNKTGKWDR